MYKLTLENRSYNKVSFIFSEAEKMHELVKTALENGCDELSVKIEIMKSKE